MRHGRQVGGVGLQQDAVQRDALDVFADGGFLESHHAADPHVPVAAEAAQAVEGFGAAAEGVEIAPQVQVAAVGDDGEKVLRSLPQMDVDGQVPGGGELQLGAESRLLLLLGVSILLL